ncbi:hypothetical protein FB451DRAFT_1195027 [Mycena latifolia]|nr:hypothetical protein FB451DRAFT_1195027 [Mycena latifolia]
MSTSAAGILPVSSGTLVPSSGPAAPTLPPTKAKRNALVEQAKYIDACDLMMTISPDSVDVLRQFYKDDEQWGQIVKRFREAAENDTNQLKHKTNWSQEIGPAHQRLDGQVRPGYQTPDAARRSCSLVAPPQNQCSSRARASEKHQSDTVEPAEATPYIMLILNSPASLISLYHALLLRVLQRCACFHSFPLVSRKNQAVPPVNASSALLSIQSAFSRTDRFSALSSP